MVTMFFKMYHTVSKNIQYSNLLVNRVKEMICSVQQINAYGTSKDTNQRFKRLIKNLQHQTIETRLNAVYELEQISHDLPQYSWLIIKILCNFIHEQTSGISSTQLYSYSKLPIQAALHVITSSNIRNDLENQQLDLSNIDIRGANLRTANLEGANLYRVNLSGADLSEANLCGSILTAADLSGANLSGADLSGAILSAANLTGANLTGANLAGTNLYLADLREVIFHETRFNGANLREVKFTTSDTSNSHPLNILCPKSTNQSESD
jgi:hypothetical protein